MSKNLDKIMDNKQVDEREIYENGKIYKNGLEKLLIITNIICFMKIFIPFDRIFPDIWNGKVADIDMLNENILMFFINLTAFICITKSIKKGVFGGNIKKSTYFVSQMFILNLYSIIMAVLSLIGINEVTFGIVTLSCMALIAPTLFIYDYIIYKKYIKYNK